MRQLNFNVIRILNIAAVCTIITLAFLVDKVIIYDLTTANKTEANYHNVCRKWKSFFRIKASLAAVLNS